MRRRTFLSALGIGTAAAATGQVAAADGTIGTTSEGGTAEDIQAMAFVSSSGLLDANMDPLTDDSMVPVAAEPTARMIDKDGEGDVVTYPDDVSIPLVAVDGTVVGVGAPFVDDGGLIPELAGEDPLVDLGNEEFALNLYDEYVDGDTILWDESHDQFYSLDRFRNFETYAEDNGYALEPTADLTADLGGADAVVIQSATSSFSEAELSALSDFVDDGGAVFLHDQSDFNDFDTTDNLNAVAEGLGVGFRFNDGEANDAESNLGIGYNLLTSNFNTEAFDLFADREGIVVDLRKGETYEATVTGVADGDTFDVAFAAEDVGLQTDYTATVRVLGIDTPESPGVAATAERPEEWEGLAYGSGGGGSIDALAFDSTASLLNANDDPLTADAGVLAYAEDTATNEDADDNGDAVPYPDDVPIPLVARDGNVVGAGAIMVTDDGGPPPGNRDFLLNAYDRLVGSGTILWDESHDQFYGLDTVSNFEAAAEEAGYEMAGTADLTADLGSADAVVITSPSSAFTDAELSALSDFVADGGAVFLHDQADFNDFDATANLDAVADALDLSFRFNDDQVVDGENNDGAPFVPTTDEFAGPAALYESRGGLENTTQYLLDWAGNASAFAEDALSGQTVRISFDENEPLRDPTRLLAYAEYDADGDGSYDTLYNRQVIEGGYGRVYGSSLSRHDEFWAAENEAREAGRGVWAESDVSAASPYRDRPVAELFFPDAVSVRTDAGAVERGRVAVAAADTATQNGGAVAYDTPPLAAIDDSAGVGLVGAPIIDESYEAGEGHPVDTSGYENFAFLTNLIDYLATRREGPVYIDGGHGQFGAAYALSSEDAAYYQRHLEGEGIDLEQINDLTLDRLSNARALIVTTPASALSAAELSALREYRDDGGAVVLLGSAAAPAAARSNLNAVADGLGSDLRLNDDRVTDATNNVGGDANVPTTTNFNQGIPAFSDALERADADEDGEIEREEFSAAVSDWARGEYTTAELRQILNAWITGG
jgi:endonuclease YncB( thermonuclease family)